MAFSVAGKSGRIGGGESGENGGKKMSRKVRGNQKHMTGEDRAYIEDALQRNMSFKEIAKYLSKDPTTISKEIKKHRVTQKPNNFNNGGNNQCKHMKACQKRDICGVGRHCRFPCRQCGSCNAVCPDFERNICSRTVKAPFVCNGCERKSACRLEKQYYRASVAQREYQELLVSAREGINMTDSEFQELDAIVSPLVKRGQSIAHICAGHANEILVTERTIYNYFDQNLFTAINLDLPRKVKYKKRKTHARKEPCDYSIREGRTYEDFHKYVAQNPELSIVEMDTVEGGKGGKVLLTFLIRSCRLQLAFLMESKSQSCVRECFQWLRGTLGEILFSTVFAVILTDNGSEFLDPLSLECDSDGITRIRVFFCDPNCSYQKGMLEKNHEYIRYVLPKGSSFDHLSQNHINLLLNHLNSSARDSLNGKTPFQTGEFLLPTPFLPALNLLKIPPDEVFLKPQLLN